MTTVKGDNPGRVWERAIRAECRELRERGISNIRKNWEAPVVPGKNHLRIETSAPDFGGCAIIHGQPTSVLFEAKTIKRGNFRRQNLSGDQIDDLEFHAQLGGLSFVYIWRRSDDTQWIVSIDHKSLTGNAGKTVVLERDPLGPVGPVEKKAGETFIDTLERSGICG